MVWVVFGRGGDGWIDRWMDGDVRVVVERRGGLCVSYRKRRRRRRGRTWRVF